MAFTRRRQEDRSSPSLGYRISSDRQPGIEQANIRRGPTGRTLADSISTLPERSFNYFPPPGLDRIGNLPGAKPPTYMVDQITDALGIGDRRKERYIAATQGGYPNVGMRKGIGSLGEGFYGRDGEFVEVPLGGAEDRLDSILGDVLSPTYEGFSPSFPGNLDVRYPGDFITSGQGIMETLPQTSGLWQTWKKILSRTKNVDLANDWLASQQAV